VTLLLALGIIAAIAAGIWLLDKVVDGVADAAIALVALPFRGLWRQAETNRYAHELGTTQSFRVAMSAEEASQVISTLPGVAEAATPGPLMPHYRHRENGRVVIAVGNDTQGIYEASVAVHAGDDGDTLGEVTVLWWSGPPRSSLAAHHDLLDTVFLALHAVTPQLAVASAPAAGPGAGVATRLAPAPATAWPNHRRQSSSVARHLPAIPTAAIVVLALAVVVALAVGSGTFHTTTKDELCSSYESALGVVNDDTTIDVTDEVSDLADKAKGYDDGDVRDDGGELEDIDGMFSPSTFSSATTHIAGVCS
jgi:hypothetical protein